MQTPIPSVPNGADELAQTAVKCYLSAMVAVAESMAEVCPDIGLAYQKRLQRIPMRLGFHLTPKTLDESRSTLEAEIKQFSEITAQYVRCAPPALERVIASGATVVDAIADSTSSLVTGLQSLADRIDVAVDMDDLAEIRRLLKHQSGGLKMCAQRIEQTLAPAAAELRNHLNDSRQNLERIRDFVTVDPVTRLANRMGFEQQLDYWITKGRPFCLVMLECGKEQISQKILTKEQIGYAASQIAMRLGTEFRPNDVLCRLDLNRFAVIFDGDVVIARVRAPQIARNLTGKYPLVEGETGKKVKFEVTVEVIELQNRELNELLNEVYAHRESIGAPAKEEPEGELAEATARRVHARRK
ncbi:MAG TPA: GGDEF domain-containing protein [Bryobacteraceae bacterium]